MRLGGVGGARPAQCTVIVVVAVAVLALLVPAPVPAGSPAPEMLLFEEPVITGATKSAQASAEAPSDVTVITREDIRRFGYRTLADALRSVRGFYGSYDRNYSYVGVRGFLRPGDYSDRVLVLVNGHTYNDDIYHAAFTGPEFGIDMEAIEHIEVIRGPGSALYGGNALFAVINVVTLQAGEAPGVRPLAETGSFWRKRGQVSVGHAFESGLEVYGSASALDVDGHQELFYPEFDTPETNNGIARDADGERAFNSFLSARYGDLRFQAAANLREKHVPTAAFGTTFNDDALKTSDSRSFAELQFRRLVRPDLEVHARAFYDGYYYYGDYPYPTDDASAQNIDRCWSYWFGSELRARWQAFAGNHLTAGAELTYHPAVYQENSDIGGVTYFRDRRSYDAWGLYLQDEWALLPKLSLVTGVRFDRYYDRVNELSPRIALLWHPLERTTLKLLVGRAFRPPNLYEQYYNTTAAEPIQLASPQLDAETMLTYEAVLEHRLESGAQGLVALYHYNIDGLIDVVSIDDGAATQYRNLDNVEAWGAELGVRIPVHDRVQLHADYSYQDVRADGRLLDNSPQHLGHASLLLPLPFGAEAGVDLAVVGPRLTLQGRDVETAYPVNVTVNLPPLRGFRLSASVYNLLDQRYYDPGGTEHLQERIRQDGLTFRVKVSHAF